jgi:hypothetical protein
MGKSTLVTKTNGHAALAEHGQRLRMCDIRDRIYESDILDLSIAMAQTGRDLVIDPKTNEIEDIGPLEQKTRSDYIKLLAHKLISNAPIPKEMKQEPESSLEKWAKYLDAENK